jgi:hypothetical protein
MLGSYMPVLYSMVCRRISNPLLRTTVLRVYLETQCQRYILFQMTDDYGISFIVNLDMGTNHCTCNCKRFECCGLLCTHIFLVLQAQNISTIPPSLVNDR